MDKQANLPYEVFCNLMRNICLAGGTACFHCRECGRKTWMFEGKLELAYKQVWCRCGAERDLMIDYDAEL